jgi:hypothetical protein
MITAITMYLLAQTEEIYPPPLLLAAASITFSMMLDLFILIGIATIIAKIS